MLSRKKLPKLKKHPINPKLKYHKRIHLMNKLVPGISINKQIVVETEGTDETKKEELNIDNKMSASNEKTKIDILDGNKVIRKKIGSAYCLPGEINDNTLMIILDELLFKIMEQRGEKFEVKINIRDKETNKITETISKSYSNINEVKEDFKTEYLFPNDFKSAISTYLINLLEPLKKNMDTKEMKQIIKKAY